MTDENPTPEIPVADMPKYLYLFDKLEQEGQLTEAESTELVTSIFRDHADWEQYLTEAVQLIMPEEKENIRQCMIHMNAMPGQGDFAHLTNVTALFARLGFFIFNVINARMMEVISQLVIVKRTTKGNSHDKS